MIPQNPPGPDQSEDCLHLHVAAPAAVLEAAAKEEAARKAAAEKQAALAAIVKGEWSP